MPLLVAVDDAQWSDRASLAFLVALADRVAELQIAVVVAVRSGEPTSPRTLWSVWLRAPAGRCCAQPR